jgi:hypothetical protein
MTEQTAQKYINKIKELEKRVEALEQEPKSEWEHDHEILKAYADGGNNVLDKIRVEIIQSIQNGTIKIESGNEELFRILDEYNSESEG